MRDGGPPLPPTCAFAQDKLTGDHSHTTGNVAGIGTGSTYDTTAGATRTTGVTAGTTNTHTHQPVGEKIKDKLHIGTGHGGTSAAAGGQHHHLIGGMDRKDSSSSSSSDEEGGKGIVGSGQQYTAIEEHTVVRWDCSCAVFYQRNNVFFTADQGPRHDCEGTSSC